MTSDIEAGKAFEVIHSREFDEWLNSNKHLTDSEDARDTFQAGRESMQPEIDRLREALEKSRKIAAKYKSHANAKQSQYDKLLAKQALNQEDKS